MNTLSTEVNRLLGHALLDGEIGRRLLGANRRALLSGYQLTAEEAQVVLNSRATSLPALATELWAALSHPNPQLDIPDTRVIARRLGIQPITDRELGLAVKRAIGAMECPDGARSMPIGCHSGRAAA